MNRKAAAVRHAPAFATPFRLFGLFAPAIAIAAALAACGSTPSNTASTGARDAFGASMSFTSRRPASTIASCLASRIGSVHRSVDGTATRLAVGASERDYAWLITLTPAATGTLVKLRKASNDEGPVPEPDMRFYIARCTT